MSKPNTNEQPTVVEGVVIDHPAAPAKEKGRVRKTIGKVVTTVKEHKKAAIAAAGLVVLTGGAAYLGRSTAPTCDEHAEVDTDTDDVYELDAVQAETEIA